MRGLDPRIHLKEKSIEEDGLPGQARQRHSWQKIEGWAKAHLAPGPPASNKTPRSGHARALPTLQVRPTRLYSRGWIAGSSPTTTSGATISRRARRAGGRSGLARRPDRPSARTGV